VPLTLERIKPRLLGHWGTTPGLNFLHVHLNRLIKQNDLNMVYVIGPGHGRLGIVANTYLEGSFTKRFPAIERRGLRPRSTRRCIEFWKSTRLFDPAARRASGAL